MQPDTYWTTMVALGGAFLVILVYLARELDKAFARIERIERALDDDTPPPYPLNMLDPRLDYRLYLPADSDQTLN